MTSPAAGGREGLAGGAAWAVGAAVSFAVMMTSVRHLGGRFDAFELVLVRSLVGLLMVAPLVARSGLRALRPARLPLHLLRTLLALFAMVTLYYALAEIQVADAVSLTFLIPLFTTVAAAAVLRERVDGHRWAATAVGLCGALVVIRPGFGAFEAPMLLAVLSSVLYAGAWSCVKVLTRTDSAVVTVFWMNVFMVPLTAVPAGFAWTDPGPGDAVPLLVMAVSGWAAHVCQARAFAAADASAVMPFDFLRLPFGALFGYALFSEVADARVWVGAAVIFLSAYYITLREGVRGRE